MSKKLKQLLEQANAKSLQEDGTVADLGPAPTGHIVDDKKEKEDET